MVSLELAGFVIDALGKILISFTAIMVHYRVWKEHKIDERVFIEMKKERNVGIAGLILIIVGSLMQFPSFF